MRLQTKLLLVFVLFISLFLASTSKSLAACQLAPGTGCTPIFASDSQLQNRVSSLQQTGTATYSPTTLYVGYEVTCSGDRITIPYCRNVLNSSGAANGCTTGETDAANTNFITQSGKTYLVGEIPLDNTAMTEMMGKQLVQQSVNVNVWSGSYLCSESQIPANNITTSESCSIGVNATVNAKGTYDIRTTVSGNLIPAKPYQILFTSPNTPGLPWIGKSTDTFTVNSPADPVQKAFSDIQANAGDYEACVVPQDRADIINCASAITNCTKIFPLNGALTTPPTFPDTPHVDNNPSGDYAICSQIPPSETVAVASCTACYGTSTDPKASHGIWTAIGCIKGDAKSIVGQILSLGLGMAGGIALLMILGAAFIFSTSQNDPKKVSQAKELITSAVIGLLFIIFSVIILQFIGVTILHIPDFGV